LGSVPGRLQVVHLACHGHIDEARPRLSCLILAQGEVLSLDVLSGLRIPAELAVLSACETGSGASHRGEGVIGLTGGFLSAGCPRVLVTLWKVADRTTSDLMAAFYDRHLKGGLTVIASLRQAQLAALAASGAAARLCHWAAFTAWGTWE
jgi:CHAT domain-containing protein